MEDCREHFMRFVGEMEKKVGKERKEKSKEMEEMKLK